MFFFADCRHSRHIICKLAWLPCVDCRFFSHCDCIVLCRLDATLKELTSLVKEVNVDARQKGTFFDFAIVYPDDRTPIYHYREIGTTCSGKKGQHDTVNLAQSNFVIGDYLDIAISPPENDNKSGAGAGTRLPPYPRPRGPRGRPF